MSRESKERVTTLLNARLTSALVLRDSQLETIHARWIRKIKPSSAPSGPGPYPDLASNATSETEEID